MNYKGILFLCMMWLCAVAVDAQTQQQRLEKHVYYMAADSLGGRKAGSADARKVADYIEREYRQMGLKPLFDSYQLNFSMLAFRGIRLDADPAGQGPVYRDVVAVIEGCDPVLKNEYEVIGGHYDHLGVKDGKVYNGADDNASGTACVIEVARQLLDHRDELKRSVVICAFDAEEIGLNGSSALAEKMAAQGMLDRVKVMMSIDMVGWLKQGKSLRLEGVGTLKNGEAVLHEVAQQVGIRISTKRFESSPFTATDTEPFASYAGHHVPTLAVTTGLKSPYHKPEDDAELIDFAGLSQVADYLSALVLRMASDQGSVVASGRVAAKHLGRPKVFEWGVVVGYDLSKMVFDRSMFQCDDAIGLMTGVSANCNFGRYLGLQADVLYQRANAPYPDEADIFGPADRYHQHGVLVPVQIRAMLGNSTLGLNVGVGGFYGYRFNGSLSHGDAKTVFAGAHQYGVAWSIELRMANLSFDFSFYNQMNAPFAPAATSVIPSSKLHSYSATLGWYF